MAAHAILSPSNAHRWLMCTPSALLERQFPDEASIYADLGTFAHKWGETQLRHFLAPDMAAEKKAFQKEIEKLRKETDKNGEPYWSRSLEDYVEEYVSTVTGKFLEARERDSAAVLLLEQKLEFGEWVPGGFGRGDAVIVADGLMEIVDLKYGQNVRVQAQGNPQLRLYALGAYQELSCIYDISRVAVTIVQPRNGGTSSEELSVKELLDWGEWVKPIAQMAIKGKGEPRPGEHCLFCRAKNRCRTLAEYEMEVAKAQFEDLRLLSDEDISSILGRADSLISWAKGVKDYALKEALENGKKWPGWKIVQGRSNRAISDESRAAELLSSAGYAEKDFDKPREIQGFTVLEKLLGKKKLSELLSEVIIKPPGKPKLAPESDPREEWNTAKEDFEKLED